VSRAAAHISALSAASSLEPIWHDLECGAYEADIPLWRRLAAAARKRSGAPCDVLEIGSGTGRVSLALARGQCCVSALDVDPELAAELRGRAEQRGLAIDVHVADARSFVFDSSFDLVLAPMLFAQLLNETERRGMLSSIERHLRPGARAAFALLELDEEWEADVAEAPPPDRMERDGWVYSSHAVAVRQIIDTNRIELDRVRRVISPDGELVVETLSRIPLELVSPAQLEAEGSAAGLVAESRRRVSATKEHVANTIVILRKPATVSARSTING
jgi:SAM-dependent methyltransferase